MKIEYKSINEFEKSELEELFLSINWDSGKYPDKLKKALSISYKVISAWDDNKLVGLINCLSDGNMVAYFHYLLVHSDYQKKGIGRELLNRMLVECKNIRQKVIISYNEQINFYKKLGFQVSENCASMHINEF